MSDKEQSKVMTGTPLAEITQTTPGFEMFLDKHQTKLIVLGIVLVLAAVGYVIFKGVKQGGEETAGALLVQAEDAADYQAVVKNHEGTAAARSARVLLADMQWEDGQESEAIATLKALLAEEKDYAGIAVAKASLASKLRESGNLDEAGALYKELTMDAKAGFLAPYAWICIGDMAASKGDKDGAREAYEQVQKEFPKSRFLQSANARLVLLDAEKPVEVEPKIVLPDVKISDDKETSEVPTSGAEGGQGALLDILKEGAAEEQKPELPKDEKSKEEAVEEQDSELPKDETKQEGE